MTLDVASLAEMAAVPGSLSSFFSVPAVAMAAVSLEETMAVDADVTMTAGSGSSFCFASAAMATAAVDAETPAADFPVFFTFPGLSHSADSPNRPEAYA